MLQKTHLAIAVFFILLLINFVEHKIVFVAIALLSSFIPDIDSKYSFIGRRKINRVLQWFTKHRGITHSFSFLILITILFALFLPVVSLGFFLGYGLHLLADGFTINGIIAFYPSKKTISWKIRTGGKLESLIFISFLVLDVLLLFLRV